jgi:hypothetical protein
MTEDDQVDAILERLEAIQTTYLFQLSVMKEAFSKQSVKSAVAFAI